MDEAQIRQWRESLIRLIERNQKDKNWNYFVAETREYQTKLGVLNSILDIKDKPLLKEYKIKLGDPKLDKG